MKFLLLAVIMVFFSGCIFWGVSGSFGSGTSNVQTAIRFPLEVGKQQGKFSSQIKEGMTREEVTRIAGNPDRIDDKDDPLYVERLREQNDELGYVLEIWHYDVPERFVVYFKDEKVSEVKYFGEREITPEEGAHQPVDL